MPWYRRWGWVVFALFCALVFLFGVFPGPWFDEDGLANDDKVLLAVYAAGTAVFGLAITLTAFRRGERWAWLVFWFWPIFFVVHGAVFFFVDFIFAAIAVATLAATRPMKRDSSSKAASRPSTV